MSRFYREDLKQNGMTSPAELSNFAIDTIRIISEHLLARPVSVLDVGCGSGRQMQRITEHLGKEVLAQRVGIDWSAKTIELHQTLGIFDSVVHTESDRLPFADREFDIAISIENIEHLYKDAVVPAIQELCRVANYVILITPLPQDVINQSWLSMEIPNAEADTEPVDLADFLILEGTVHKSALYTDSLIDAGFVFNPDSYHGFYFGISDNIDTTKIKHVGIDRQAIPDNADNYNSYYIQLLRDSKNLVV